jgi:hypothetical protein
MNDQPLHQELQDQAAQPIIFESLEAAQEALEKMSAELLDLVKRHPVTAQVFFLAFSYGNPDDAGKTSYRYRALVSGPSDLLRQMPESIRKTVDATIEANEKRQNKTDDEGVLFIPDKGGQIH